MISWAIDGPGFQGIKKKQFRGKKEDWRQTEDKERGLETDGRQGETNRENLAETDSERSRRRLFLYFFS